MHAFMIAFQEAQRNLCKPHYAHPVQWLFNLFGIKFFFFLCKTRQMFSISIALLVHFRFAVYASI